MADRISAGIAFEKPLTLGQPEEEWIKWRITGDDIGIDDHGTYIGLSLGRDREGPIPPRTQFLYLLASPTVMRQLACDLLTAAEYIEGGPPPRHLGRNLA